MSLKQKVNDKCLCGSNKKYKKCCKIDVLHKHNYLPPQSESQSIARFTSDILMKNIQEPHCKVCGDTEKDGKIFKIPTQTNDIYLCQFCYNVQKNM
jgi:hypothetical protein